MSQGSVSNSAAAIAVAVAFVVGMVGSLSIRPPGERDAAPVSENREAVSNRISWRLPVSFSSNMPVIGDNPIYVTDMLRSSSSGAVDLQVFEPGELVPAFGITDAVRDGKLEAGYTWLGYDQGKIPASALIAAVPFGMEPWEFAAWWYEAGGRQLGEELYSAHNVHPILCGMTGPETAGWFRERIETLDDVQGLKIRFAGIGGKVIERVGASVTMIPGGEIFQALEKGAIDASEYALPIVDQALGFNRIASYNYYPGWHQPSTASHMVVNMQVWERISKADQKLIEIACTAGVIRNLANSEAKQGAIIAGFPDIGVSAQTLPEALLRELEKVTEQVLEEEAARDDHFRRILTAQREFRSDYAHWKALAYLPRDF
ncbi:MAG: TRAP transporter substrate-binding protein [Pseudomonadales bacterium]|jgi:TRAP-type mannitol/chloroaromatic compound transport system substrate-binding protein|nr:TRAP transporter substrate-binding protein [Pseudomonadales bacterium]MDP6470169.1 TRAP transporter substrate-binding protein [Pseudomonadales bacterium]MDP6827075.1 TRAP transporter substrate-binding protein [Pseudomonadales bacterium]|tara:strand:- start:228 stop:1349 length:1122 start_codon:yes stop_codon:yes gene_type:complete